MVTLLEMPSSLRMACWKFDFIFETSDRVICCCVEVTLYSSSNTFISFWISADSAPVIGTAISLLMYSLMMDRSSAISLSRLSFSLCWLSIQERSFSFYYFIDMHRLWAFRAYFLSLVFSFTSYEFY